MPSTNKSANTETLPAGDFGQWLLQIQQLDDTAPGIEVDCGECNACCRASFFIHIHPQEQQTLRQIPKALLFPAPGLAKGHSLLGYDQQGRCPLLREQGCTIYPHRPNTCRRFDCRIFTATGISSEEPRLRDIVARARLWRFTYVSQLDRLRHQQVKATAQFLTQNSKIYPGGFNTVNPVQKAAITVQLFSLFGERLFPHGSQTPSPTTALIESIGRWAQSNN